MSSLDGLARGLKHRKAQLATHGLSLRKLGPPPPASSPVTHRVMVSNRGRDTGLELRLRRAVRRVGIKRYRVNHRVGRTRVDIAFPSKKVAVLVHGCFWHHCPRCHLPLPKTHRQFWARKFALNRARDERVRLSLQAAGWTVLELWEHEIRENLSGCIRRIRSASGN